MRSVFRVLLAVLVALSLSAGAAAVAVADEDSGPTVEIDSDAETEAETARQEIDSDLRLMEWRYDDGRGGFELTFDADRSKRITITEAVQFDEGSGEGRIYQERLPSGMSEIFVPVPRRGGEAAVTMTTAETIEQNRFAYVSTGEQPPDRPALDYERVQALVVLTAGLSAGAVVGVFVYRREDRHEDWERLI